MECEAVRGSCDSSVMVFFFMEGMEINNIHSPNQYAHPHSLPPPLSPVGGRRVRPLYFGQFPDNNLYIRMRAALSIRFHFRHFNKGQSTAVPKNVNLEKDYYKILQIQPNTTEHHIRKSYFRLAKKLHPDVNPNGHHQFTEIQEAYNILTTKELKDYYDQNNPFHPQPHPQPSTHAQHPHPTSNNPQDDLNYRNHAFYEKMKNPNWHTHEEPHYTKAEDKEWEREWGREKEKEEDSAEARERKKFEDELQLTRSILFSRNPIWARANAYMSYEQRQRQVDEKEKQLQNIFPGGTRIINSMLKRWNLKG